MRPINKGDLLIKYEDYRYYKSHLIDAIGPYCSYCEMNIQNQPDIEHILPKSKYPEKENDWDNLLLAC